MRSQQQAEKEEQQRIKNLVLNYDLRDENDGNSVDGESPDFFLQPNPNRHTPSGNLITITHDTSTQAHTRTLTQNRNVDKQKNQGIIERTAHIQNPYLQPRMDKAGNRSKQQQARKLQLSDVDWSEEPSRRGATSRGRGRGRGRGGGGRGRGRRY